MTLDQISRPLVPNFLWSQGELSATVDLSDAETRAETLREAHGHFALVESGRHGEIVLARDPLGVNKLFFGLDGSGAFDWSNYWFDLLDRGFKPGQIWSVPSGHCMTLNLAKRSLALDRYTDFQFNDGDHVLEDEVMAQADHVRERLAALFRRLKPLTAGRKLYVTLSGGLDSSTIAVLAREIIGDFTAVTFCVHDGTAGFQPSDDYIMAARLAEDLGVDFLPVLVSEEELIESLDVVLRYGQDWRDFNVHCGLVNAAVGKAISQAQPAGAPAARPLLLTGDVMNEIMVDYEAVHYAGKDYYRLPRLPMAKLRRWLLSGLDTGDREVGVLQHYGIDVVQPYALCVEDYLGVPAAMLAQPKAKQDFVKRVMGDRIPRYIYERPKVRAQVGSEESVGGTLAALVRHGIDSHQLSQRFAALFSIDPSYLNEFIRAGYYRFTASYPD